MTSTIPTKFQKPVLTGDEVADLLGMKNRSLHRLVQLGELPTKTRGKEVADMTFRFDDVMAFKEKIDARKSSPQDDGDHIAMVSIDSAQVLIPPKFNRPALNGGDVALFLNVSFRTLYGFVKRRELEPIGRVAKELKDMSFKLKDVVQMKLKLEEERRGSPVNISGVPATENDGVQAVRLFQRPPEVLNSSVTLPPRNPKYQHVKELATIGDVLRAKVEEATPAPQPVAESVPVPPMAETTQMLAEIIQMPVVEVKPEPVTDSAPEHVTDSAPEHVTESVNLDVEVAVEQPIQTQEQTEEDLKNNEMLTSEQARALSDMPPGTFYGRVKAGHLPYKEKDGKKTFRRGDVMAFRDLFADVKPTKPAKHAAKKQTHKPTVAEQGKKYPNLEKAWQARRDSAAAAKKAPEPKPTEAPKKSDTPVPAVKPRGMRVVIYRPETVKLPETALKQLFKIFPFDHEKTTLILGKVGIDKLNVLAMLYEGAGPNPYEQIISALSGDLRVELAVDA